MKGNELLALLDNSVKTENFIKNHQSKGVLPCNSDVMVALARNDLMAGTMGQFLPQLRDF